MSDLDHPNLYGGYDDAEDLASKIDNEGFDYFFGDYTDEKGFAGSILEQPIKEYIAAKEKLKGILEKIGATV